MKRRAGPVEITAAKWRRLHLLGNPPRIAGDPEVREFLKKALRTMSFKRAAEACGQRFGARAPGKSAIHRYWKKYWQEPRQNRAGVACAGRVATTLR
ncbi:MAG: hypothetical protein HYY78_12255 [Betaproteobacteria bacterium]|nr:hypothetical protein [Betaproteobacteria bacterium]